MEHPVKHIIDFFKFLGHELGLVMHLVHEIVPNDQLQQGIALVKQAAVQYEDNQQRREWVAMELMSVFHLPESIARLITELAVSFVKKETGAAIDAITKDAA